MGYDGVLHNCRFLFEASSREAGAAAELAASNEVVKYAALSSQVNSSNCGGVPRPNQQACSSVLEQVGQAIGGNDRGCSSIFFFYSNGFPLWSNTHLPPPPHSSRKLYSCGNSV